MMGIGAGQMPGGSCLDANQKKRLLWGAKKAEAAVGGAAGYCFRLPATPPLSRIIQAFLTFRLLRYEIRACSLLPTV